MSKKKKLQLTNLYLLNKTRNCGFFIAQKLIFWVMFLMRGEGVLFQLEIECGY